MDFGFTNDPARQAAAIAWRDAAIADGWQARATYGDHEAFERASTLERDGFKALILTRTDAGQWKFQAQVSLWGPDRLKIEPPNLYDWPVIQEGVRTCGYCGAKDVDTERVNFACRCCAPCLPEVRKTAERPGWDA